jgi:penicillin-binding protein 1B
VILGVFGAGLLVAAVTTAEALIRSRIHSPADRMPTALYTRPVAWGRDESRPVAIAPVDGAPREYRIPMALSDLPDHLIDAVLAVEDQRFHDHGGIDWRRLGGAMVANVKAGGIAQGGSTITQQLAKNLFLTADRTPIRKMREAAMALVLESRYDKETLLEAYLNEIYLGQDGGAAIHGVAAASRFHLGKDVRRLDVAEAALLAGMIHAPNRLAPSRHPRDARSRRDLVLDLMEEQGKLSSSAARRARRVAVRTRTHPSGTIDARYFRDVAAGALHGRVPKRGAAVFTTLDADLQRQAERAVAWGVRRFRGGEVQAALVAIDPRTGDILAMVGGRDYGASQFNRAVDARRQPGSAFKPVVALAALEPDRRREPSYTLASVIDDAPLRVETASGPWQPANYDQAFRGPVTFRTALEQSLNVPFARIGLEIGPQRIVDAARRLGITSPLEPVPALALGSGEVSLLELVRAYGVFATGGTLARSRTIIGRVGTDGELDEQDRVQTEQVVDPAVAYLVTSALRGVVQRGTGAELSEVDFRSEVAGKSGTTNDWRDAWFVAYSPALVVGVWVGRDDGTSIRSTGTRAALPIVARFLGGAKPAHWESFEVPDGVVEGWSGLEGDGWMEPCGEREVFLQGTEPSDRGCFEFDFSDDGLGDRWAEVLRERAREWLREVIQRQSGDRRRRSR